MDNITMQHLDFHRTMYVLIPEGNEPQDTETFLVEPPDSKQKPRLFCSCGSKKGYADCTHAKKLHSLYEQYTSQKGTEKPYSIFLKSIYWKLFEPVSRLSSTGAATLHCATGTQAPSLALLDTKNNPVIIWSSDDNSGMRLRDRMGALRYTLMNKALGFIRSEQEKQLIALGHKTQRQTVEDSVWYRLAYHLFREDQGDTRFDFEIDAESHSFVLLVNQEKYSARIYIPSKAVPDILSILTTSCPETCSRKIITGEHDLFFKFNCPNTENIYCVPCICLHNDTTQHVHTVKKHAVYGSVVYISETDRFVRVNSTSLSLLATGWGDTKQISPGEISSFLEKNISSLSLGSSGEKDNTLTIDLFTNAGADDLKRILGQKMITSFDRVELCPLSLDNERCSLAVQYVCDDFRVNLSDLLTVKKQKQRFYFSEKAIVDCASTAIKPALVSSKGANAQGTLTFSRAALLQFRASPFSTHFSGDQKLVSQIREMLDFKPPAELEKQSLYNGDLRTYQKIGVQWLLFLYDNNFGGLLCDDMGLGKTHQVLSFIASVKEHRKSNGPILIVCPTTVIGHWQKIIQSFAPALGTVVFHSQDRLLQLDKNYDILITSYAILRIDNMLLSTIRFDCAVFDEAQTLKNRNTSTFGSAASIRANVKIALTGTPIENSLSDLKSLFAITLPGLLSSHDDSSEDVLNSFGSSDEYIDIDNMRYLTAPFILRRLKESVLGELPPKIIDKRVCTLSNDQFGMYQALLEKKATPLIAQLCDNQEEVSYMHVFSILNKFKQICCHPALDSENPVAAYESSTSDKWELFKELLDESIGSGQKVVVFSQYLDMIAIIDDYLTKMSIGHSVLTGASKKRDHLIRQFAEDPSCKVFVASLKAGGVGIDLVSASVVIHYDRWWNAAREDQATDRVHRIGQKRGVQVFKLITEGTIEEHIDRIIEAKKSIAEEALTEDSADSLKQFSREELVELLSLRR